MYFNQGNAGHLALSGSGKLVYQGGDLSTVNGWISQGKITGGQAAQVGNNIEISVVPEPASLSLLGLGALPFLLRRHRTLSPS
jgi:hypothetical protein